MSLTSPLSIGLVGDLVTDLIGAPGAVGAPYIFQNNDEFDFQDGTEFEFN